KKKEGVILMEPGDLLAVYGTLRIGEGADLSRQHDASYVTTDNINGLLYSLGGYPGLKLLPGAGHIKDYDTPEEYSSDLPNVPCDIFQLNSQALIERLDAYEGYPSLYTRAVLETETGLKVWVYIYNHDVTDREQISSWPIDYVA